MLFSVFAPAVAADAQRPPTASDGAPHVPANGLQKIALGEYQCFFLVNGQILGIGSNRAGELGIGPLGNASHAIPIALKVSPQLRFIDVAAGGYHSLAVDISGHVWTWGSNLFGQKGNGMGSGTPIPGVPQDDPIPFMIQTDSTGKPFDGVACVTSALWFNIAVKKDGTLWVWGCNRDLGILGNGDTTTVAVNRPTQVPFDPPASIVEASTSRDMILARDARGGVWSWAGGDAPKHNRGSGDNDFTHPKRLPKLPPIKQIAAGDQFSVALDINGELWGWGMRGTLLGLGPPQGDDIRLTTPTKLSFPEFGKHRIASVTTSAYTIHVILDDGTLWGWGESAMGGVGNGTIMDLSKTKYVWDRKPNSLLVFRPVRIAPQVKNFQCVSSNALCFYTYAFTTDGRMFSWGRNKTAIMGNGVLPTGQVAERPDSWEVATATEVWPLTLKTVTRVPSK